MAHTEVIIDRWFVLIAESNSILFRPHLVGLWKACGLTKSQFNFSTDLEKRDHIRNLVEVCLLALAQFSCINSAVWKHEASSL